jgi:hypothetical protein
MKTIKKILLDSLILTAFVLLIVYAGSVYVRAGAWVVKSAAAKLEAMAVVPQLPEPAPLRTLYVNNEHASAIDNSTGGLTPELPIRTFRYAASVARPGDLILVGNPGSTEPYRDGSGPESFTRSGTATAPITYRAVGDVTLGQFNDVRDEDFAATDVPNVYSLTTSAGIPWQTFWPDIPVRDSNGVSYDMKATDGPLALSQAPDDASLARVEGTYRNVGGVLRVHPFGNRVPSSTETDFVVGVGRSMNTTTSTNFLVFDGFRVTYTGSAYSWQFFGYGHSLKNMTWVGVVLNLRGSRSTVENYNVTHVHQRDPQGGFAWDFRGIGTAAALYGSAHRLTNGHLWHNWNSSITNESATGIVVDGVRAHGSPNHCGVASTGNSIVRNVKMWNCQDVQWSYDVSNMLLEHFTMPGGLPLEAKDRPLGPITVRNSIFSGNITWVRGLPERCTWEAGSLFENNVMHANATIERCADLAHQIPLQTYIERCASGVYTGCATFRNNRFVTNWSEVLVGGWFITDGRGDVWNTALAPGSPAIDIGASTTPTDIIGAPRPQGASADAGVHEGCSCPVFVRRPGM